jgi:hypothetical protein
MLGMKDHSNTTFWLVEGSSVSKSSTFMQIWLREKKERETATGHHVRYSMG